MRLYIDLWNGRTWLRDETGVEVDVVDAALQHIEAAVREMRQDDDLQDVSSGWSIVVRDAGGVVHRTVSIDPSTDDPDP